MDPQAAMATTKVTALSFEAEFMRWYCVSCLFTFLLYVSYRWIPHARMARQWLSRNPSGLTALRSRTGTGSDGLTLGPCCRHWLLVQMLRAPQILPWPMPPCWSVENKPAITREESYQDELSSNCLALSGLICIPGICTLMLSTNQGTIQWL